MMRLYPPPRDRVVLLVLLIVFIISEKAKAPIMRMLEKPGLVWELQVDRAVTGQPVVDGDRLYYSTEDGALYCVGRFLMGEKWRFNAGALVRPRPWFSGSKIFFVAGGTLFALDKKTGKEIWKFAAGQQMNAGLAVDRGLVFTSAPDKKLAALDLNSGSVKWEADVNTSMMEARLVAAHGMVFFPCKESSICAFDAETGRRNWDFPLAGNSASNMFVAEDRLFFSSSFVAFSVDVQTGRKVWHRKMGLNNESFSYHDGTVYYLDRECNLQTVDAKTGKNKGTFPIKPCTYGYVLSEPLYSKDSMYVPRLIEKKEQKGTYRALLEIDIVNHRFARQIHMEPGRPYPSGITYADGKLYYGSIYGLNAIDLRWGHQTLAIQTGGKLSTSPARIGNRIVVGTSYGALLFTSASKGEVVLQVGLANSAVNTPVVLEDTVLVSAEDGLLAAVDGTSGVVKWRYNTGYSASAPVIGGDTVLVDDGKGAVHSVGIDSGKRRWLFTGGARLFPESIHSGRVFVGGSDDSLHVLDLKTGVKKKSLELDTGVMSLAVSDDKLLVRTHSGRMYMLDASDGSERWNTMLLSASGSTPILSGDIVLFGEGKYLVAMDVNGKDVRWRFRAEADDKQVDQDITVAATPIVYSGVVYAGSDDETLYALDLKTGKLLWRFEVTGPVRSEPIVVNEFLVFTSADGGMYAVDISPTPFVWQFSTKGAPTFETSVFNDLILTGDTAGIFYALDAKSGEERWRFKPNGKVLSSPAFQKEVLYLGDDDGVLYALELKTGKEKWRIRTRSSHVGSPIVMGSTVYVASSKTETTMQGISTGPLYSYLHAYDIWTGAEKWCFGAVDGIREDLMLHAGGVVFRTTQGLLISVDRHSGKQRWRINIGSRYGAGRYRVLFEKGRAFMLGSEKNSPVLVAVDLADGNIIWKRKVHGFSLRRQADLVTVSMHDGQRCFSMKTGKTKSCPSKPVRRGRSAVTHGGTAYYYCGRGYLCAEDEKSGKERWRVPVKGYPRYDPIFHEGLLYVTTSMGHICALDPKSMR